MKELSLKERIAELENDVTLLKSKIFKQKKEITWLKLWEELEKNSDTNRIDKNIMQELEAYYFYLFSIIAGDEVSNTKNNLKKIVLAKDTEDNISWFFTASYKDEFIIMISYDNYSNKETYTLSVDILTSYYKTLCSSKISTPFTYADGDVYYNDLKKVKE